MPYRKLDKSEEVIIEKQIEHLLALFADIKKRNTHAYSYDWRGTANDLAAINDRLLKILMQDEREYEKRQEVNKNKMDVLTNSHRKEIDSKFKTKK